MPTFNQLVHRGCEATTCKSTAPVMQKGLNTLQNRMIGLPSPQKRGVCIAVRTATPERPNSALCKIACMRLTNGMKIVAYIPGVGHNLQGHSVTMTHGDRVKGLSSAHYYIIRGTLDVQGVANRMQVHSKYGAKRSRAGKK